MGDRKRIRQCDRRARVGANRALSQLRIRCTGGGRFERQARPACAPDHPAALLTGFSIARKAGEYTCIRR